MYGVIISRSIEGNVRYQAILNYTEMYQHREKGIWLSIPNFICMYLLKKILYLQGFFVWGSLFYAIFTPFLHGFIWLSVRKPRFADNF